jgi:phage shock protein A
MGLIDRLSDIINANLSHLLDRTDDPIGALNQAIRALEDALSDARCSTVRMMADRKTLSASWQTAEFEMLDWERKAETAIAHDREDLARAALAAREEVRRASAPLEKEISALNAAIAACHEDAKALEVKLAEAHAKRQSLLRRYESASDRLFVRSRLYANALDDAMQRCAAAERAIDIREAQGDVLTMGRAPSLEETLESMEKKARIDEALAALKRKRADGSNPRPSINL